MEYYNKTFRDEDQTERENIVDNDSIDNNNNNNKIKQVSSMHTLLSSPTKNISNIGSEENALNAMREQWWSNIFDPTNSQFDVI